MRDHRRVATTLGIGPRCLHLTGQLHEGGPRRGVFWQVLDDEFEDVAIPGQGHSFGGLLRAQAAGDLRTLREGTARRPGRLDELLEVTG